MTERKRQATMHIRNPKDFWSGIIYLFFGTGAFIIARDYPMGTALKMGPSYFPSILSVLLVLVGIISVIRSLIRPGSPVGTFAFKGLLLVIVSTVIFGLLLRSAGLIIALPVMVIISAYGSMYFRWPTAIAMAVGLTVFCVLIFLKGLGVPLPLLGSWFGN
jgi:hypothetical protein